MATRLKSRIITACRSNVSRMTPFGPLSLVAVLVLGAIPSLFGAWRPGLQYGKVPNRTAIDTETYPAETNSALFVEHATRGGSFWGDNTMWVYWGQIYLDGSTYRFGESIDDRAYLEIDGEVLFDDADWQRSAFGTIRRPAGWYSFELRMQNGTGGAGPASKSGFTATNGVGYVKGDAPAVEGLVDGTTFVVPRDPGDGTLLRYDDGQGFDDRLQILGSPSSFGVVSPPYGALQGLEPGGVVTCTAPESVSIDGATYRLAGYSVYDVDQMTQARTNTVASGTASRYEYIHRGHMRELEWRWEVESIDVSISAGAHGSVSSTGGTYGPGERVVVSATPDAGHVFLRWEGDVAGLGIDPEDPSLSFTPSFPVSLVASFQPVYYVSVDGNDENTGATPLDPLATVSNAVGRANRTTGRVVVSKGRYELSGELLLTNAVQVRGATGKAEDVVISRPSTARPFRIFNINHAEAKVSFLTVEGGKITDGWVYGAGAQIASAGGRLTHCIIRNCMCQAKWSAAAGLFVDSPAGFVSHCIVTNNLSHRQPDSGTPSGGVLRLRNGHVENSLFAYNLVRADSSRDGHMVSVDGGELVNCTIVRNTATAVAGVHASGAGRVRNCLIAGNTTPAATAEFPCWGGLAENFSRCATDVVPINDNCLTGPGIALTDLRNGDFHPMASSFCVDGGEEVEVGSTDLDGGRRVSGDGIDIGCYEFDQSAFSVGFTVSTVEAFAPVAITLKATATGVAQGDEVEYHWIARSASETVRSEARDPVFEHLYDHPGIYDVTLCARNRTTGKSAEVSSSAVFLVGAKTIHVVSGNPAAAYPYASWETAAATVRSAIDSALEGAEIVVSNGLYLLDQGIMLEKEVTIRGATGRPEDVILQRNPKFGNVRILDMNAGPGAFVHGLTLSDGRADGGAGLWIHSKGGSVSNCIIRNNRCTGKWTRGGGFLLETPDRFITHCVISNNTSEAGWDGGFVHGTAGDVLQGRLEHSLITGNYPQQNWDGKFRQTLNIKNGAIRYCTVADNVSTNCAGINCLGGTVEHCVVAGNRSTRPEEDFSAWGTIATATGGHSNLALSNNFVRCALDVAPMNANCLRGSAEDLFVSYGTDDFHHRRGSPAIDLVPPAVAGAMPSVDLDGKPRLEHRRYDLGCYEATYVTPGTVLFLR